MGKCAWITQCRGNGRKDGCDASSYMSLPSPISKYKSSRGNLEKMSQATIIQLLYTIKIVEESTGHEVPLPISYRYRLQRNPAQAAAQ